MNVLMVPLLVAFALVCYAAACTVVGFLHNVLRHCAGRAAAWCAGRWASRRRWRRFVAEHGGDFTGPEFQWPAAVPAPGRGPLGGAR